MPPALEQRIGMGLTQHQSLGFFPETGQPPLTFRGEGAGLMALQQHVVKHNFVTVHSALSNLPESLVRQVIHGLKFCLESLWKVFFHQWRQAASKHLNNDFVYRAGHSPGLCLQSLVKMLWQLEGNSTNRRSVPFWQFLRAWLIALISNIISY